jgi:hypothetical protein
MRNIATLGRARTIVVALLPWAAVLLALPNLRCAQTHSTREESAARHPQPAATDNGHGMSGTVTSDSGTNAGMSMSHASDASAAAPGTPLADAHAADAEVMSPSVPAPPRIPVIDTECPVLATGSVNVLGKQVRLWVGERRDDVAGAILLYWHASGSDADEAAQARSGTRSKAARLTSASPRP